jgi:hypothetical protein
LQKYSFFEFGNVITLIIADGCCGVSFEFLLVRTRHWVCVQLQ